MNLQNAGEFIKAGAAAIAAGGELVDKKAVAEKKFSVVAENARKFLAEVKKARGKGLIVAGHHLQSPRKRKKGRVGWG